MAIQSTCIMLQKMADKNKTESTAGFVQEAAELYDAPQLKPDPELEQLLSNILGASSSKKNSPMD